ncbi:MAG TPA: PNGase F N-terminal domain-containing protein [Ignavibacteria bacterium]|nr:PNGase F N-terminal domain-containing protein [Ignavibacteria bacterium]HRF67544.1 PNGase F N-terminal domain-containing protein [Ignavibacteria bacterium]HRJ05752.1 PNGase F N-terminal domain-containing protein [Ignavibacteria bacterium]
MKLTILLLFLLSFPLFAQNSATITYNFYSNGAPAGTPPLILEASADLSVYTNAAGETFYLDYTSSKTYQTTTLKNGEVITDEESFSTYNVPELHNDTMTILGYLCKKASVVIRSNHIDIWYTTQTDFKGTPSISIGPALGLVLKVIRNGNFEIRAENIELSTKMITLPYSLGNIIELPYYRYLVTAQNYTTVNIFQNEKINYGDKPVNLLTNSPDITYRFSEGTVILRKVKLPENMGAHSVIAELTERSAGDAYDRTGSLFIIPDITKDTSLTFIDAFINGIKALPLYEAKNNKDYRGFTLTDKYTPPIELMRFITPFGIGHYNSQVQVYGVTWEDSLTYKQDITNLLPAIEGEVWFGVFIGCYDKGGHEVSLRLKYYPDDIPQEVQSVPKAFIQPLMFTTNIMEASSQEYSTIFETDTLTVDVDIPEGIKELTLRYISTGHGGWGGGDEFNKKMNYIFADGKLVYSFIPWRDDCGMYRKYNPASGNFPNGMSSSDFSRSGWCPGSTSVPVDIPLSLMPGRHTVSVYIPLGKPEGTSFSAWNVSAVLIGKY